MNHPRAWRAFTNLAGTALAVLMLNCGGGGGGSTPAPPPAPVATSLTTSNATPAYGATFTLTPTYSAGTGTLSNGVVCPASGVASAPIPATWTGARTYTLTVMNAANVIATKSVVVTPQTVAVGAISPANPTKTVNSTTTFTTTVTGGDLNTVTWTASDGSPFVGNVWTAPPTPGSVTITATSVDDPTKTATTTVTVVGVPVATSLVASAATPAFGATFTLTPTYSGGTGAIDKGVTCPATTVASAPITANWAGTRRFTLTVTNDAGLPATTYVDVTPQVVAVGSISPANPTKTVNSTTTFATTVTGGVLNTVTWSASDGSSFVENVWTAPPTAGSVTITATSVDDPTKTATTTVTVVGVPVATSLVASAATPAFGATFTLTPTYADGTGAIDNGVTCPASGTPVNVTANWAGTRRFILTVTNDAGLPATTTVDVTPQVVAVVSISPAAPTKTVNSTTTFSATVTGGALNTVTWSASAGSFNGDLWTAPPTAGPVTITATSVDDPSKTATATVTVVGVPSITSFTAAKSTITNGLGTSLSYAFTGGAGVINPGNIAVTTGGTTNVSPTTDTTYTLTVTNDAEDIDTATATIAVVPAATITSFTASATTVAPGSTITLTPVFAGGDGIINPGNIAVTSGVATSSITLSATTIFTLTVTNAALDAETLSVTVNVVAPGAFAAAGTMSSRRSAPTATLLNDNASVLVVGGTNGGSLNTAEVYSSATGAFAAPVSMSVGRTSHAATRLADGKVLITGGKDSVSGQVLATAEIYNPLDGTFTATGNMATARQDHTATLLPNDLVLIAGGTDDINIKGAELFNPAGNAGVGTFTALTDAWPAGRTRALHTATLLANGKVLLAGGYNVAVYGTADTYDYTTNTFTPVGDMNLIRWGHTATLLANGKVLFAGGRNGTETAGNVLNVAEIFDPAGNLGVGSFTTVTAPMIAAREWHAASRLDDGKVLIAGGDRDENDPGGNLVYLASAEIYDPVEGTFTATASMGATRVDSSATLVTPAVGTPFVLIIGGGTTGATEKFTQ